MMNKLIKVFYLLKCLDETESGVNKKIFSQVKHLINLNIDIKVLFISGDIPNFKLDQYIEQIYVSGLEKNSPKWIFKKINRMYTIDKTVGNIVKKLEYNDILYMRIPFPSFTIVNIFRMRRKCKIIIEYQTIEPLEYKLFHNYLYAFFDFFYGNAIRKHTDAIVGVTDEITQYQLSRAGNPNKPHITIGNGFDVASAPIRHPPTTNTTTLHLLCVANVSRWHGLDRLFRGIAAYSGTPNVMLHIAGDGSELPYLQKLTNELGISDRVIFHGFTTGKDLDGLFKTCHIAVGSLGIHRKGLTQTSELKVREYCARGIPWIIACKDPDFPEDFPYIHRLPADESPVNMDEVVKFSVKACNDPDHPVKMRSYAIEHLDWSVKMKKLKAFLEALVDESPSIS